MAFPTGWNYIYKQIIHGSPDGSESDYTMPVIRIEYDDRMNSDFSDIRFADTDRTTQLEYKLIKKVDEDFADFVVKIPSIPADPNTKNIYMFFGNSSATDESIATLDYFYFYDFNTLDEWTNTGVTVSEGIVDIPQNGDISKDISHISSPYIVEVRYKQTDSRRNRLYLTTSPSSQSPTGSDFFIGKYGQIYYGSNTGVYISNATWYRMQFENSASDYVWTILNDSKSSTVYTHNKGSAISGLDSLHFLATEYSDSHFQIDWVTVSEDELSITTAPPTWGVSYEVTSDLILTSVTVNEENYVDWLWQNPLTITGSPSGQLVNYPVLITVPYDARFMQYDFGDIRFGTDYGLNLPYFERQIVEGDFAEFWVNIPVIPASPDTITIYLYAGNDLVESRSNGFETFDLFDDFNEDYTVGLDTSKWSTSIGAGGAVALSDGELIVRAGNTFNTTVTTNANFGENYALGIKAKIPRTTYGTANFGFDDGSTRYIRQYIDPTLSQFNVNDAGTPDNGSDVDSTYDPEDYHVYEMIHKNGVNISENIDFTPVEDSTVAISTALPIKLHCYGAGVYQYIYVEYIYVRKAIANEPAIGELGTWSTTQHSELKKALVNIPFWEDYQALMCIRPLREDFQALLNITGYAEPEIQALINILPIIAQNYVGLYQATLEINADAGAKDVQSLINIGSVTDGSMEIYGKILYNYNKSAINTETATGLSSDDSNVQFVINLGGRIYG